MIKPSWKNAPDWAKYLVMDSRGTWFWHEKRPIRSIMDGTWVAKSRVKTDIAGYHDNSTWRSSLEKRPASSTGR